MTDVSDNDVLRKYVSQFEVFLTSTIDARNLSERDSDYVHHKQWTDDEAQTLKDRNQAPVVVNRIKTKVNLLNGVQRQRRSDPKALPRTPQHEKDADSITDALRFVADNTDFEITSSQCFEDKTVWGYEAAVVEVDPNNPDLEVSITRINPDRFYFDPFSRRLDFKDAKYMGIVLWMDAEDAKTVFPGNDKEIDDMLDGRTDPAEGETFEDKPVWVDRKRKRLRICQHYSLEDGVWHVSYFNHFLFLIDPRPSPYLNEQGDPENPIEAESAYIDRENCRYGEVRSYIDAQDEINHRRSRALHLLSARQTIGDRGAVDDIDETKRELAKADGHIVVNPNKNFEIVPNDDFTQGQLALYQDAKGDIDSIGANAALSGTPEENLSGRAIQALQQGGIAELGCLVRWSFVLGATDLSSGLEPHQAVLE